MNSKTDLARNAINAHRAKKEAERLEADQRVRDGAARLIRVLKRDLQYNAQPEDITLIRNYEHPILSAAEFTIEGVTLRTTYESRWHRLADIDAPITVNGEAVAVTLPSQEEKEYANHTLYVHAINGKHDFSFAMRDNDRPVRDVADLGHYIRMAAERLRLDQEANRRRRGRLSLW